MKRKSTLYLFLTIAFYLITYTWCSHSSEIDELLDSVESGIKTWQIRDASESIDRARKKLILTRRTFDLPI